MARKAARREWTAGDIRDLKSLAKKKTPAGKIAKSLKRTVGATRQKAFSLGVSLILVDNPKSTTAPSLGQLTEVPRKRNG